MASQPVKNNRPKQATIETDCLIIGAGLAGSAYSILAAEAGLSCVLISAGAGIDNANSDWAQGGIIYAPPERPDGLRKDIFEASGKTANPKAINSLSNHGAEIIKSFLIDELNVPFDRDDTGNLKFTREGGHSKARIIYSKDRTGHHILEAVHNRLRGMPAIDFRPEYTAVDLLTPSHHSENLSDKYGELSCIGAYVLELKTGKVLTVKARKTVLATGGLGQIFERTTNQPGIVGSGIAMAYRIGARVMDLEYIQFHPTVFHRKNCPPFLISEAVRGEGGILINKNGEAFMDAIHPLGSLAPRDIIARAIHRELFEKKTDCVYIDLSGVDSEYVRARFPNIYNRCKSYEVDITREPVPVSPAAHYLCGGIYTGLKGRTTIRNLNAIGETACTGLHGANRLASTSLLECLTAAKLTIQQDAREIRRRKVAMPEVRQWKDNTLQGDPVLLEQDMNLIRKTLWNYAGIVRSRKRLERAKKVLWEIKEAVDETYRTHRLSGALLELRDASQAALLVVYAASRNPTSAGCHYIIDD